MKIELNLKEVPENVLFCLINEKIISEGILTLEQKINYYGSWGYTSIIECDDLTLTEKIAMVECRNGSALHFSTNNGYVTDYNNSNYIDKVKKILVFITKHMEHDWILKFGIETINTFLYHQKEFNKKTFYTLFSFIEECSFNLADYQKKDIKLKFWKYVEKCNTYATATHIYPENTPEWCVNLYLGDYDSIQRRIALHKATGWKHYDPKKPDNRVQVRAAYAAVFGTNKEQAIHDNAYSLRLKAVDEHNIKL